MAKYNDTSSQIHINTNIHNSSVKLSEDVITSIVEIAINEVEGAKSIEPSITDKLTKQSRTQVLINEDSITIDADISVDYGLNIKDIVAKIQENILSNITIMTSLNVDRININVVDINL